MLNNRYQPNRGQMRGGFFEAGDAFEQRDTQRRGVVLAKWRGFSVKATKIVWMYTVRWADGQEDVLESMEFSCTHVQGAN